MWYNSGIYTTEKTQYAHIQKRGEIPCASISPHTYHRGFSFVYSLPSTLLSIGNNISSNFVPFIVLFFHCFDK